MSLGAIGALGAASPGTVDPTRTPASQSQLRAAIDRAYKRVTGQAASAPLLDTLTAQASLETGQGAQMYNWNFGGIKGSSPSGQTTQCLTHEVVLGSTQTVKQGFRAYGSIDEGAEDYVRVLRKNFGAALGKAELADIGGFAHALKQAGYYTASESDYANALRGQNTTAAPAPAPSIDTSLDAFFDSAGLTRITNALSESALRIASPLQDPSGT
jgi:peptidoglycan hydrolase FlgJ